jgi:2-polyprenyl-3-methyl-5-hydroxy-6-metoxy-1,4-benzoquinol methylase
LTKSLNIEEIRPAVLMEIRDKLYQEDLKILNNSDKIKVNCPACNSNNHIDFLTIYNSTLVKCSNCLTIFIHDRPTENALENFHTNSKSGEFWEKIYQKTEIVRKEKIFKPRIKMVNEILKEYGVADCNTMLEVGCGYGWFLELAKESKLANHFIAVEPSPKFCEACKRIPGIEVVQKTIEKYKSNINADLIVNFELISQLFDPSSFLKSCYERLTSNGMLIFSTTNGLALDIEMLREKHDLISPHILNLFNPESITVLLKSVGFRNIKIMTPGLYDISNIIEKSKSNSIADKFFSIILNKNNPELIDDMQLLVQKYLLSSHMVVSAQK